MARTWRVAALLLLLVGVFIPAIALSQDEPDFEVEELERRIMECQEQYGLDPFEQPSLRRVEGGEWECVPPSKPFQFDFGVLLVVAFLWSLVPFGIALFVASERGESQGTALLLVLVLGWVGLGIVLFGMKRTKSTLKEALDDEPPPPSAGPGSYTGPV